MASFRYTITTEEGLHARPAGHFVKEAQSFADNDITLAKGDKKADAKRLFSVMGLGARKDDEIEVTVEGPGAEDAANKLKSFCESNL